jgi:hypothetical protein
VSPIVNWMPVAVSTNFRSSATISAYRVALTLLTLSSVPSISSGMPSTTQRGAGARPLDRGKTRHASPTERQTANRKITTNDRK